MTLDLGEGKWAHVNAFKGQVWLKLYNGTGVILPLSSEQAIELEASLRNCRRKLCQSGDGS